MIDEFGIGPPGILGIEISHADTFIACQFMKQPCDVHLYCLHVNVGICCWL
jgi:hypothetical protein